MLSRKCSSWHSQVFYLESFLWNVQPYILRRLANYQSAYCTKALGSWLAQVCASMLKSVKSGKLNLCWTVFGAPDRANRGQLLCVPAGLASDVEAVLPYCKDVMGRAVINLSGKQPEAATTLKVIGNSMIFNMVESVAEGHVLAEKSGLGGEHLHQY